MTLNLPNSRARPIHPLALRMMHWVNAIAIITLIGSGWEIYDASPFLPLTFPQWATIGQWLGGAIAWHLAAIWLLMVNGALYLGWGLVSGHFRSKLLPLTPRGVLRDAILAARFQLPHRPGVYNAVQRLLYLGVIALGILAVLSGLAVWKPVQLWPLSDLFGGFFDSRVVHFIAMTGIALFLVVHLLLVALVPRVLPAMITGGHQPMTDSTSSHSEIAE
ncbi:MAG: thioredoxin reductase [Acidiphilium sp. 37-64-53]|uniref:cytochrome b/b6 domain-containing protein n=1 Tax=Acidiphilium sp. 37-64-53 TaxID=1970299 RepID=UPI000BCF6076|nr:cytochrome b/b6 domain-containing protein [Acidiphilium sp. 37-64-53]OYV99735.1 MAG: thioredoxin reductase [Acidiphilium sp. 37-64-53]HQT90250.1 cytochrome b/b6 domain-containing protein [Acidiphilium sp.]